MRMSVECEDGISFSSSKQHNLLNLLTQKILYGKQKNQRRKYEEKHVNCLSLLLGT